MSSFTNYKVRRGNAIPLLCNNNATSEGLIIFTFGTETQEVINCSVEEDVIHTTDMCMFTDGEYYSASYKAHPGKVNGQLRYSANLTKPPQRSGDYDDSNNCDGNSDTFCSSNVGARVEGDF